MNSVARSERRRSSYRAHQHTCNPRGSVSHDDAEALADSGTRSFQESTASPRRPRPCPAEEGRSMSTAETNSPYYEFILTCIPISLNRLLARIGVIYWYGPSPLRLRSIRGSSCLPQASRPRRHPSWLGRFLVATP